MNIELIQLDLSFYNIQQFITRILYLNLYLQKPVFLIFIFLSGILTSLNPCMISMLPISFSYIGILDNNKTNTLSFFCGLLSSLMGFIILFSILNYKYHNVIIGLPVFSSIFTFILGLFILKILRLGEIVNSPIFFSNYINNTYISNYLLGLFLGMNTSSCSIPIVLTLLLILSSSSNYILIYLYIIVYLLGYMFILLLLLFLIWRLRYMQKILFVFTSSIFVRFSGCIALILGLLRLLENICL
uniref:Cytochrome c biogenesis protein transmembrane region n=1 Tax=Synarthrophyton chejuense TaxID=2485825 RepID=A0A3G3MFN6_9FLOR|nr:cytochrome c biogenesis protein transmembrane region [Synarthrophyton chejuense]AYR05643.1 cytochrome c biogenesis protein transmembrane region [Synarthrophyton chejuense]